MFMIPMPMNFPVVIKIGGALLKEPAILADFWPALQQLSQNSPVIVVHGGGPQATAMARRLGHEPTIVDGRRVTTDLDLSIVHWTLCGELNTGLVAQAIKHGVPAVGLSSIAGHTLKVHRRPPWTINGETVDFGKVGDVESVDPALLQTLMASRFVPFVAPLGIDKEGQTYNVNADTVAHAIATSVNAGAFLMVTESGGVRENASDPASRITQMDAALYEQGATAGWIKDGMLVKLKMAFAAKNAGIPEVHILSPGDIFSRAEGTEIVG